MAKQKSTAEDMKREEISVPVIPTLPPNSKDPRQVAGTRKEIHPGVLPPQGHKYILWKNKTDKYTSLDNWVRLRGGICPRCGQPIVEQMREKELKEVERANKKGSNYNPKISSKYYSKLNTKEKTLVDGEIEAHLETKDHNENPQIKWDWEIPIGFLQGRILTKMNIADVFSGVDENDPDE